MAGCFETQHNGGKIPLEEYLKFERLLAALSPEQEDFGCGHPIHPRLSAALRPRDLQVFVCAQMNLVFSEGTSCPFLSPPCPCLSLRP